MTKLEPARTLGRNHFILKGVSNVKLSTSSSRRAIRGILGICAITAALAIPSSAMAITGPASVDYGYTYADGTEDITLSFERVYKGVWPFGSYDTVDGIEFTGPFSKVVAGSTCATHSSATCTLKVRFTAPADPADPLVTGSVKLLSSHNGTQHDITVPLRSIVIPVAEDGDKGEPGEQGPKG